MSRPVKWSGDLFPIREKPNVPARDLNRKDIEALFGFGRANPLSLMRAMGDLQNVGGAHLVGPRFPAQFAGRHHRRSFREAGLRLRMLGADAPPSRKRSVFL